jgi:hypothetical protein
MHTTRFAVAVCLFATSAVKAQETSPDSMPHKGTWAAEAFVGTSSGASILRFRSTNVALLFGADLSYSHAGESEGSGYFLQSGTSWNVAARLGMRKYRGSRTDRLRPVVGGGLRTSYSENLSVVRAWSAGAYGELGAVYLLTHHISLGGTGELQASYGQQKRTTNSSPTGGPGTSKQNVATVGLSLMRVMLAVYF